MSDFIVSARKYRPSTFDSVVGQEALTTTLKNAIQNNKLSHAYLFCGPRGVGKTSCARIFAKTINCENRTAEGEACNKCESCVAANEQRSYNITELDAASNNSVNDIRQLIEQVYIAPTSGKYRVYIIDEVHMLSSSAFNAFLKTLEEPPAHAIFILATTEKHKVLPTIISRCQVHDFSRITSMDIAQHLQKIANAEQITADPEALQMIGIAADGGMRDALSMFDQIASFGGGEISISGVRQNLNLLDEDDYFSLLGYILKGLHKQVLSLIDQLLYKGYEGNIIMRGFSTFLRNVLLSQSQETLSIIEVPQSIKERMIKAGQYAPAYLLWEFLKISTNFSGQYKNSSDKRLMMEIALLSMCEKVSGSALKAPSTGGEASQPVPLSGNANSGQNQPPSRNYSSMVGANTNNRPAASTGGSQAPKQSATEVLINSQETAIRSGQQIPPQQQPNVATSAPHSTTTASRTEPVPKGNTKGTSNKQKYAFDLTTGKRAVNEEANRYEKPVDLRNERYTQEELNNAWRIYAHSKNPIISKMLDRQDNPPTLLQNGAIQYKVTSKVEKEQMDELLPELVHYLSNKLKNDHLSIHIEFDPEANIQSTAPVTLKDKFDSLTNANPWIERMCEDLDLNYSS